MRNEYFSSKRLLFSIWEETDLDLAKQLWQNPTVAKYLTTSNYFSDKKVKERLQFEIASFQQFNIQYWPLFTKRDNLFIGCVGLRPHNQSTLEIGFHLLPEFWGMGYGFEAATAVIKQATNLQNITHLFAGHHPENITSEHLLLKLGFQYSGTSYYPPTNLNHPSYLLALEKATD